jgi:hypothetical protein
MTGKDPVSDGLNNSAFICSGLPKSPAPAIGISTNSCLITDDDAWARDDFAIKNAKLKIMVERKTDLKVFMKIDFLKH